METTSSAHTQIRRLKQTGKKLGAMISSEAHLHPSEDSVYVCIQGFKVFDEAPDRWKK